MRIRALWLKSVLAALVLLAALLTFPGPAHAPAPEKAEKLSIDTVTWDEGGQEFKVALSCKFGMATAGEHAGFTTSTSLELGPEAGGQLLGPVVNPVKPKESKPDDDGYVKIDPTPIPWDRMGGTYEGTTTVNVTVELKTPGVAAGRSHIFSIWITVGFFEVEDIR